MSEILMSNEYDGTMILVPAAFLSGKKKNLSNRMKNKKYKSNFRGISHTCLNYQHFL